MRPVPSTTHTLLSSSDTSITAKYSMAVLLDAWGRHSTPFTQALWGRSRRPGTSSSRRQPSPIRHLKLCGPGEWLVEKHGTRTRRSWRKLHLGVDADTGQIVASALTTNDVDDGAQADPLLDQVTGPVASVTGDGAYDQEGVYASVTKRHPEAAVIVPPRSSTVLSADAETAPTQRDRHLQGVGAWIR